MRSPPDRHLDNRWNAALDALTKAWNELGPDAAVASLQALTGLHATAGGVAPGEGRAGICAGCGRSRYLHADGTVIAHRPGGPRSPAECGGSNRPPSGSGPERSGGRGGMTRPSPQLWVCYCGVVAAHSDNFPHWDCQGGRPLSPEEIAAREAAA